MRLDERNISVSAWCEPEDGCDHECCALDHKGIADNRVG